MELFSYTNHSILKGKNAFSINLRENTTIIFTFAKKLHLISRNKRSHISSSLDFTKISQIFLKLTEKSTKQHLFDSASKEEFFKLLVYIVAALFHYDF